jgi:beta-lactamase regulating signal transducer with metallopeptidase domain
MDSLLLYILKSGISLALFYGIYWIFLKNETYFAVNRFYLLGAILISALIPLVKLPSPILVQHPVQWTDSALSSSAYTQSSAPKIGEILAVIYVLGATLFFIRFMAQLIQAFRIVKRAAYHHPTGYRIVNVDTDTPPFSFFGTIFIHQSHFSDSELDRIIAHEQIHIRQMHSIDLILMELLIIFQWYNPFVWPYKRSLKETHEYLADAGVIAQGFSTATYQLLILEQSVGEKLFAFANNFKQSQIKRRITMMSKHKSKKWAKGKLLLIAPLIGLLVLAFARPRLITNPDSSQQPLLLNAELLSSVAPQDKAVAGTYKAEDTEKDKEKYKAMKMKYEENRLKEKEMTKEFEKKKALYQEKYNKAELEEEKKQIESDMQKLKIKWAAFNEDAAKKQQHEEQELQTMAKKLKIEEGVAVENTEAGYEKEMIQKISDDMARIDKKMQEAKTDEEKKELALKREQLAQKRDGLKKQFMKLQEEEKKKQAFEEQARKESNSKSKGTTL